jgi:hypothetical protein
MLKNWRHLIRVLRLLFHDSALNIKNNGSDIVNRGLC